MNRIFVVALIVATIAIFGIGCCKCGEKAKDLVDFGKMGEKLAKEMDNLKDADGNFTLTQERIDKFIKNYPIYMKIIKEKVQNIDETKGDLAKNVVGFAEVSKIYNDLHKAGIDNIAEFFLTTNEVWLGVSYVLGMRTIESAKPDIDKSIEQAKALLDDPKVPEEQKKAIRDAITSAETQKSSIQKPDALTDEEIALIDANLEKLGEVMDFKVNKVESKTELESEGKEEVEVSKEKPAKEETESAPQPKSDVPMKPGKKTRVE